MRIIDKNTDFYDFYSNIYRDDSITFDRRGSFILTKHDIDEAIFYSISNYGYSDNSKRIGILCQIGNVFWLFRIAGGSYESGFKLALVSTWENYKIAKQLIKINLIYNYEFALYHPLDNATERNISYIQDLINTHDYKILRTISENRKCVYNKKTKEYIDEIKTIPILAESGLTAEMDGLKIYLALEEYFFKEATASERTESIGITDVDKAEMHGFDKKKSFRGKNK